MYSSIISILPVIIAISLTLIITFIFKNIIKKYYFICPECGFIFDSKTNKTSLIYNNYKTQCPNCSYSGYIKAHEDKEDKDAKNI
jgi:nonstructural protein NSm